MVPEDDVHAPSQQHEVAKIAAASLLSAVLLVGPTSMVPPSLAATAVATTASTGTEIPPIVLSNTLKKTSKSKAATSIPAEKQAVDAAVKDLQEASLKQVTANKVLVGAKATSERACLNVDQLQNKNKAAKEALAKLSNQKSGGRSESKIGAW